MADSALMKMFGLADRRAALRTPWQVAAALEPTPAGAVLIVDSAHAPIGWATTEIGQVGFGTTPGHRPAQDVLRHAMLMAAAPELAFVVRQVANEMPAILRMLRAGGHQPSLSLLTSVVLADRLAAELPR